MLGQLSFGSDGKLRDKVQTAIDRLKAFEPHEGYRDDGAENIDHHTKQ